VAPAHVKELKRDSIAVRADALPVDHRGTDERFGLEHPIEPAASPVAVVR
jgi:hypothetical protein